MYHLELWGVGSGNTGIEFQLISSVWISGSSYGIDKIESHTYEIRWFGRVNNRNDKNFLRFLNRVNIISITRNRCKRKMWILILVQPWDFFWRPLVFRINFSFSVGTQMTPQNKIVLFFKGFLYGTQISKLVYGCFLADIHIFGAQNWA